MDAPDSLSRILIIPIKRVKFVRNKSFIYFHRVFIVFNIVSLNYIWCVMFDANVNRLEFVSYSDFLLYYLCTNFRNLIFSWMSSTYLVAIQANEAENIRMKSLSRCRTSVFRGSDIFPRLP